MQKFSDQDYSEWQEQRSLIPETKKVLPHRSYFKVDPAISEEIISLPQGSLSGYRIARGRTI